MQQESLERAIGLEMMRDRHAQRLILVPSSKFVGYGSVDEDDEAEGLEAPYINQSKWVDYATLEASRTPEIARYAENDNLADIVAIRFLLSNDSLPATRSLIAIYDDGEWTVVAYLLSHMKCGEATLPERL